MRFYLGTHHPHWLERTDVPLFVSRRWLATRKRLPEALGTWVLDSGGFTELSLHGEWRTTPDQYTIEVSEFAAGIGKLEWVAPQDWMCEPFLLKRTGLDVGEHISRTIGSFLRLRAQLGPIVIPVLQGWTLDDYLACWDAYERAGVELERERIVGLGSVCRRQNMIEAGKIVRALVPLRLHGFGIKLSGLRSFGDALYSADSMSWSYRARRDWPLAGCTHKSCSNCLRYALRWRDRIGESLDQQRLEVAV